MIWIFKSENKMSQKFNDEYIQIQNEIDRLIKLSHQYIIVSILSFLIIKKYNFHERMDEMILDWKKIKEI